MKCQCYFSQNMSRLINHPMIYLPIAFKINQLHIPMTNATCSRMAAKH